jgi:hypothetical protein
MKLWSNISGYQLPMFQGSFLDQKSDTIISTFPSWVVQQCNERFNQHTTRTTGWVIYLVWVLVLSIAQSIAPHEAYKIHPFFTSVIGKTS